MKVSLILRTLRYTSMLKQVLDDFLTRDATFIIELEFSITTVSGGVDVLGGLGVAKALEKSFNVENFSVYLMVWVGLVAEMHKMMEDQLENL